ncbi:MAG TPA: hypothetical protein VKP14_03325 [Gaiellaceae bacterium]|nr:hypothetical protein [Gaiellaceae bacterium]
MSGNGPWHGNSRENLQKAIEAAWEAAKGDAGSPATMQVSEITFTGENPISEYSVKIVKL